MVNLICGCFEGYEGQGIMRG